MKNNITKQAIYYDCVLVGYRIYNHDHFIGYEWNEENYAYYEMFVAKRKLC